MPTVTGFDETGRQIELTVEKTADGKLVWKIKKWRKGTAVPPGTAPPSYDASTVFRGVKVSADGSKVSGKDDGDAGADPSGVDITVNCPSPLEPDKKPSVTFAPRSGEGKPLPGASTIEISAEDQDRLKAFFKPPRFPLLAAALVGPAGTGEAFAAAAPPWSPFSYESLERLGLAVEDVAQSILLRGRDWVETARSLRFVGYDPTVRATLAADADGAAGAVTLTITLAGVPSAAVEPRFRNAFLDPRRIGTIVSEDGEVSVRAATSGNGRSSRRRAPAKR